MMEEFFKILLCGFLAMVVMALLTGAVLVAGYGLLPFYISYPALTIGMGVFILILMMGIVVRG